MARRRRFGNRLRSARWAHRQRPSAWRWLWRGLGAIVLLVAVAAGGGLVWLRGSLPETEGTLLLPGLKAEVTVTRDRDGVPRIVAKDAGDAFFALGFVQSQDRLAQMEIMRLAGQGRLAEVIGARGVPMDRLMRTLGLARIAETALDELSAPSRAWLDAFAAGVNAYLAQRRGPLPLEFLLTGHVPGPWTVRDSLLWGELMTFQLSGNWRDEINRARLLRRLPAELVEELWPDWPADGATTLKPLVELYRGLDLDRLAASLPAPGFAGASNEWVVDGRASESGKPILANDPHLGLTAPGQWYLARLEAPGLTLAGAFAPGVPVLVLGHNGQVAWGFTTTGADTFDLFVERLDPADPDRYQTPDGATAFTARDEIIHVKGEPDQRLRVRTSRHGVIISDIYPAAEGAIGQGQVLALAFPAQFAPDRTPEALSRLNRAANAAEVRAALGDWQGPVQNVVYADSAGEIGFRAVGRVPRRRSGTGWLPQPGWSGAFDWDGFIAPAELPQTVNPPTGRLVNANNRIIGDDIPFFLSRDWDAPYRARRIDERLDAIARHSPAAHWEAQADRVSLYAREVLPLLLKTTAANEREQQALGLLRSWDGSIDRDRPEPLILNAWLRELGRMLIGDELGPDFPALFREHPRLIGKALQGTSRFCDDTATAKTESCAERVHTALAAALDGLEQAQGRDPARWRWGEAHVAPFHHPLLSRLPLLGRLLDFNIPADGDYYTVNRGAYVLNTAEAPFADIHGAGYRAVYDLGNLDASRFMVTPGQSGNPLSPHYGDLAQRWADNGFLTLPAKPAAEGTGEVLTLAPR